MIHQHADGAPDTLMVHPILSYFVALTLSVQLTLHFISPQLHAPFVPFSIHLYSLYIELFPPFRPEKRDELPLQPKR